MATALLASVLVDITGPAADSGRKPTMGDGRASGVFGLSRRKDQRKQDQLRALAVMRTAFSGAQRNAIELWCHKNKAHIVAWVEDDFPFGAPWHHSSLERWLAAPPPAEWDVLVAHGMERMTAADLVDWCGDHGKRLVLAAERVDSGAWVRPSTLPR